MKAARLLALPLLALPLLTSAAPVPEGEVVVELRGLRSTKGQVLACLTARPKSFPGCRSDPAARTQKVAAADAATLRFAALPPGRYAISLLHDENGNGKADMALMVPKEGFGFSRDAAVRFGPPKFAAAAFAVGDAMVGMPIRMRYLL